MSQEFAERAPPVVRAEPFDAHGSVIVVDGELDLETAPQLQVGIAGQIACGHRHLLVDLSAATFMDSVAMRMLLYAIAPLRDDPDAAVVLVGAHGMVERALEASGIGAMFAMFDTTEAAISGLNVRRETLNGTWRSLPPRPYPSL